MESKIVNKNQKAKVPPTEPNKSVGRYLTDMKELPPEGKDISETPASPEPPKKTTDEKVVSKISSKKSEGAKEPQRFTNTFYTLKDVVLGVVNLITVVSIIFLLTRLPLKLTEYKNEKAKELQNEVNPIQIYGDITEDKSRAESLSNLFLDESGVVNFVGEVEKLKGEGGAIQKVTFASEDPIKDKTGFTGIPVVIELRGTWQNISASLMKIESLPFLFRPSSVETMPIKDSANELIFNYGAILYVKEKSPTAK